MPRAIESPLLAEPSPAAPTHGNATPPRPRHDGGGGGCCLRRPRGVEVGSIVLAVLIVAVLALPLQDWDKTFVEAEESYVPLEQLRLCNNTLDWSSGDQIRLRNKPRPAMNAICTELLSDGTYTCEQDFCPEPDCKLSGLCNRECRYGLACTDLPLPSLRVCAHRALGRKESLVLIVFFVSWVNLMVPELLPLARPATALAGATLTVIVRNFGHDVQEGLSAGFEEKNVEWIDMNAFDTIELPVIALLAGLMVLAGFMEHLGAFDSLAYFIQHPLCLCTCTCTCLSTPCHRRRRRGRGAARPSGFDYAQYTSATPAPLTAAGTSDGGGGSCGCGGGRKLDQAQARQCKQIAKNALVLVVLACMTTLFLLGPLIKANVGATAFGTALVCLIGLGITSARSAQHDTTAAAGDRTTRAITRAVIEQAQATLLRGTIFADRDSQSGQWSTSQQSGGNFTHHRMSSLVKSQTSEQQGGTDECCVGAPPHGSGQHGEVQVQEDEEEDEEEDAIIMGGEGAAAAIDGAAVRPLGRAGTIVMLCLVSGGLSSLIMNDTVALVFAPMIVSKLQGVDDRFPYLLALATAVDIGSTLTSVGNPQNNLVSIFSGLEFTIFVKFMALPVFVAMAILIVMLLWWPWKELSAAEQPPRGAERRRSEQTTATWWPSAADQIGYRPTATPPAVVGAAGSVAGAGRQPLEISLAAPGPGGPGAAGAELDVEGGEADVEEAAAAAAAVAGSAGGPLPQAASARRVREDKLTPAFLQNHIDVPLLLLFTGQFIMVQGLVDTGVPKCVWEAAMPADPLESVGDCATFVCAIVLLSNMISNVPLMLLVRPMLSELMLKDPAEAKAAWLVIAFASTMAGNLTLIGSASNLIVANNAQEEERKQARAQRRPESSSLFPAARHARFGIPLTLLTCGAGVSILYLELKVWGWSVCDSSAEQGCV